MNVEELNARFGVAGRCSFAERAPGIVVVRLSSEVSECEIALQGAHVTGFRRSGEHPLLFLSKQSAFVPGKAIRGGVPLIFPWFGAYAADPTKPQHGFARTAVWSVDSVDTTSLETSRCTLRLTSADEGANHWPNAFSCRFTVSAGRDLKMSLEVRNDSVAPFSFEEALHTYIEVSDAGSVGVTGLENCGYIDKTDAMARKRSGSAPLHLDRETDSVFLGTTATCIVRDEALGRQVVVEKSGSHSTIVWNPWAAKARAMSDLGDAEWMRFVCIESANAADNAVTLEPGASHTLSARVFAEPL